METYIPVDPEAFARKFGVRMCDVQEYELRNGVSNIARKYESQRINAGRRWIEWLFDLKSWMEVWDGKIAKRGRGLRAYCMCRNNDTGPYAPWNVRIATGYENRLDWWEKKPKWNKSYGDLPYITKTEQPAGTLARVTRKRRNELQEG